MIFKIKKPAFPFQKKIRYKLVKELKTVYHLKELESGTVYKGVRKHIVEQVN